MARRPRHTIDAPEVAAARAIEGRRPPPKIGHLPIEFRPILESLGVLAPVVPSMTQEPPLALYRPMTYVARRILPYPPDLIRQEQWLTDLADLHSVSRARRSLAERDRMYTSRHNHLVGNLRGSLNPLKKKGWLYMGTVKPANDRLDPDLSKWMAMEKP